MKTQEELRKEIQDKMERLFPEGVDEVNIKSYMGLYGEVMNKKVMKDLLGEKDKTDDMNENLCKIKEQAKREVYEEFFNNYDTKDTESKQYCYLKMLEQEHKTNEKGFIEVNTGVSEVEKASIRVDTIVYFTDFSITQLYGNEAVNNYVNHTYEEIKELIKKSKY